MPLPVNSSKTLLRSMYLRAVLKVVLFLMYLLSSRLFHSSGNVPSGDFLKSSVLGFCKYNYLRYVKVYLIGSQNFYIYPIVLKTAGKPRRKSSNKSPTVRQTQRHKKNRGLNMLLKFENLLAFPNPKSLRVFRVNRLCSTQVWLWLIITPEIGPKKGTAAWDGFMFKF